MRTENSAMGERRPIGERLAPARLPADAALFALWLAAALAAGCYLSNDRYPAYHMHWTAVVLGAALVLPLTALRALPRPGWMPPAEAWAAFFVLFAAALTFDIRPVLRPASLVGAARLLLFGGCVGLAWWNVRSARALALRLGPAMALVCLAWILCGVLRMESLAPRFGRISTLLPLLAAGAVLLPGIPRFDPLWSPFRLGVTLAAGVLLVVLPMTPRTLLPETLSGSATPARHGGRSAILIVLDTMRRDHMSLYGYSRKTTPALERWAGRGRVFDDATTVSGWTLPSHASMFTGLWPRTHGAHAVSASAEEAGEESPDGVPANVYPLAQEHMTLAEIAREHGYRTAGFTANHYYLSTRWGMDQGFEKYLCRPPRVWGLGLTRVEELAATLNKRRTVYEKKPYFNAPEVTRAAIAWLESQGDRPFFLFLNYMDAHAPNAAPGSQGLPFEDESYVSAVKRWRPSEVLAEQRSFVNEYDREVIHLDHWLGALLDHLDRSGLLDRTLVVLTSDHGEFLGEHDFLGHGKDLFSEIVDVPLIVWKPGADAGRDSRSVQTPDVFPTILGYLGLPIPPGTQGQPLLEADHAIVSEEHYTPFDRDRRFDRVMRTFRVEGYRYFQISTGEERLFHLPSDPNEVRNLIADRPLVASEARARLEEWLERTPVAPAGSKGQAPGAADLAALRALGYIH